MSSEGYGDVDHDDRPRRVLAAWGYESGGQGGSGDRVEVDVWTVNETVREDTEAVERAREAFGENVARVIAAYGNVARVEYAGAAGEGYRYIDADSKASQQAFAGAKRAAGGDIDEAGRFTTGWTTPPGAPTIEEAIKHGRERVIRPLKRDPTSGTLVQAIGRQPARDEDHEPVETSPFEGFHNVIRFYTRGGVVRYHVVGGDVRGGARWGDPAGGA